MLENFLQDPAAVERLRGSRFGPHLDSFVATRCQLGYARSTVRVQLRLLDDLERWLDRNSLALVDLHEPVVHRFLAENFHGALGVSSALDARLGWCKLAKGGCEVKVVPGGHLTMLDKPHVQVFAEELTPRLHEAQSAAEAARTEGPLQAGAQSAR